MYKPTENSANSSISYYLKGGIAFFILNSYFTASGKSIKDFIELLWKRYLDDQARGVTKEEILKMIGKVGGTKIRESFEVWIETTEELPISNALELIGLELEYDKPTKPDFGFKPKFDGDRVLFKV